MLLLLGAAAVGLVDQRVALITGGNKGIGKEIARKLISDDFVVLIGCRNTELGAAAASELQCASTRLDLTDLESIASTREYIANEYGRLDMLVNNAAICFNDPTLYGCVEHHTFEMQADITMRTNFFGSLAVTREMLPLLRAAPSPRIVNIASAAGRLRGSQEKISALTSETLSVAALEELMADFVREAQAGTHLDHGWPNTCYGVSKMGLIALTRVLARDEPSIMVNSVDPGFCATDQNQNQGYVSAERGATTAAMLGALPDERFLTGMHWFEEREMPWSYQ